MKVCATADCHREATRRVRWEWPEVGGSDYCDDCAWILWEGGDLVVPSFPIADVIPIGRLPEEET